MKGQKTGGRQKGTPNKITAEIREFLASLFFDNMDLIRQDVKDMTPEQRAVFLPKILPYIVPKQKPKTEKDEQDIACDHVKSFLNLAQIVNSWEQDQQPSSSPTETPYPVPSPEPEPSPTDEDKFQTSNFKLQNLSQRPLSPAEAPYNASGQHPQPSDPSYPSAQSNNSAPSDPSDPSNNSAPYRNLVPSPTAVPKRPVLRTPFYKALNPNKTHNKHRKRR